MRVGFVKAILWVGFCSFLTAGNLQVERETLADWETGYCENVTVTNVGDRPTKWKARLKIGKDEITEFWNAKVVKRRHRLIARGERWNRKLGPGETTDFGFCARRVYDRIVVEASGSTKRIGIEKRRIAEWEGGHCDEVTVTNRTKRKMVEWRLVDFGVDGDLIETWDAEFLPEGEGYGVTGVAWNGTLRPGKSGTFGYCVERRDPPPTDEEGSDGSDTGSEATGEIADALFDGFGVGFGGAYAFDFKGENGETVWMSSVDLVLDEKIGENDYYRTIERFDAEAFDRLHRYLSRSKYLVYWLTKSWDESWFDREKIQTAMDEGYVPVFLYWYFGDEMTGVPSEEAAEAYYENCERVAAFLEKLHGTKIVVMEPEFNKEGIVSGEESQHAFARIVAKGIDTIRNRNADALFSLCMMDTGKRGADQTYAECGYENCALGDKEEWGRSRIVYEDLKEKIDFVSFQEMVGQFSRDPQNPGTWEDPNPKAYSDEAIGIDYLARRIVNFAGFLHETYGKPVFLPYLAIASATWEDANGNGKIETEEVDEEGWNEKIVQTYEALRDRREELVRNGLFGYAPMELFDHPRHDDGGYGFFMKNEYHLGIVETGAEDETDLHPLGDIRPKGDVLPAIFGETSEGRSVYDRNVLYNRQRCEEEASGAKEREICTYIADVKMRNYHDGAIERIDPVERRRRLFVPLYSYPAWWDSENYVWRKLVEVKRNHPDLEVVAVVNPENGDFDERNDDYVHGIRDLVDAGIEVVGYVYTSYGERDTAAVFDDIDHWAAFYREEGVSGIFFDEVSTDPDALGFYTNVTNYAEARGLEFTILNPGITTHRAYIESGIANLVVTYENPYASWKESPPAEYNEPGRLTSLSMLIYEMDGDRVEELDTFAKAHGFDAVYYTEDGEDGNPWDSLSRYTPKEADLLMR